MAAYISEWFKVIKDGALLGVTTELGFARYSEKSGRVHVCKAIEGEYAIVNDRYYHDDWMNPVNPKSYIEFENAEVISISEKEYNMLVDPEKDVMEPVNVSKLYFTESEEKHETVRKNDAITIDHIRRRKLAELSAACEKAIEDGFDLTLSDGNSYHFSMSWHDQINLLDLQMALDVHDDLIYHADGELMQFYSEEDAQDILTGSKKWKSYNLALYNSLKNWVNSLNDIEAIDSVTYESEIPEEFCTPVLQTLTENF